MRQNGPIQPLQRTPVPKPRAPEQPKKESEMRPASPTPTTEANSAVDTEDAEEMTTLASLQDQHGSFLSGPCLSFSSLV